MKKSKNNNKPTNNTSEKKSKFKKSCRTLLIANEGTWKKKTSKRKKLSKTCWRPSSLKNRRDSKTLSWSKSKNKNTWLTWRNWIRERKPSRWPKKKRNRLKTKFSKNLSNKIKKEEETPSNSKTLELSFIKKSSKPRPDVNSKRKPKKDNSKSSKCNTLKERREKERRGKNSKKREWRWNSDRRCWRSFRGKTKLSRWLSKNEEWKKLNTNDKLKDCGWKSSMLSGPKNSKSKESLLRPSKIKNGSRRSFREKRKNF